jgi:hypothetical protein
VFVFLHAVGNLGANDEVPLLISACAIGDLAQLTMLAEDATPFDHASRSAVAVVKVGQPFGRE